MGDWFRSSAWRRIESKLRLTIWVGIASTASSAVAAPLAYEPFTIGAGIGEYSVGPLHGQPDPPIGPNGIAGSFFHGNWIDPVAPAGHVVQATSITTDKPGGSVTSIGDARARRYLAAPWDATTNGTFYFSFMVNFGASADPSDGVGFRSVEFWPAGSFRGAQVNSLQIGYEQFAPCGGPICSPEDDWATTMQLRVHGTTDFAQLLTDYSFNDDGIAHGVVIKFELSDAPAADTVSVYVDAVGSSLLELPAPSAIATGLDFTLGAIGAVSTFGVTGTPPVFDELRVGTTLADVLPPVADEPCAEADYACYLEIVSHMHLSGAAAGDGDVNGDGKVTIADYRFWKDNRTDTTLGAVSVIATGVPEPTSWCLVVTIVFAFVLCCRDRKCSGLWQCIECHLSASRSRFTQEFRFCREHQCNLEPA
jgi:hypothetical protein